MVERNVSHWGPLRKKVRGAVSILCFPALYSLCPTPTLPLKDSRLWKDRCQASCERRTCPMDGGPPASSVHDTLQARMGCHSLLWGTLQIQGLNPRLLCLLHHRQILCLLSYPGSPGGLAQFGLNQFRFKPKNDCLSIKVPVLIQTHFLRDCRVLIIPKVKLTAPILTMGSDPGKKKIIITQWKSEGHNRSDYSKFCAEADCIIAGLWCSFRI